MIDDILQRCVDYASYRIKNKICPARAIMPEPLTNAMNDEDLSLFGTLLLKSQIEAVHDAMNHGKRIDLPMFGAFKPKPWANTARRIRVDVLDEYGVKSEDFNKLPKDLKAMINAEIYSLAMERIIERQREDKMGGNVYRLRQSLKKFKAFDITD